MRQVLPLVLAAGLLMTWQAQAQDQRQVLANAGLGVGARAMGMGGAFTAVAEGPTAMYWNPAGLSRRADLQVDFGAIGRVDNLGVFQEARDVLDAITTDNFTADDFNTLWDAAGELAGRPVSAAATADLIVSFGHFALGGYGQAAGEAVLTRTPASGGFNPLQAAQVEVQGSGLGYYAVGGAYGRRLTPRMALGVTVKQLHVRRAAARFVGTYTPPTLPTVAAAGTPGYAQTDANESSPEDTALAADVGFLWWPKVEGYEGRFTVGLMCRNVNEPTVELPLPPLDAQHTYTFERTFSVGVAGYSLDHRWLYAADWHNLTGANGVQGTGSVGVEYQWRRWLALRAGISNWELTEGLGLDLGFLNLDVALSGTTERLVAFSSALDF